LRDRVLRRADVIDGVPVDLTITFDDGKLAVETSGEVARTSLAPRIVRMFQLGVDTAEFVSLTRSSPAHAWVERSGFGRLLCGATLFEDAIKIIATTNTTWRQTVRMVELLVDKCGPRTKNGTAAFPRPEDIVRFGAGELQRDCRLGYRAKTMHALAAGIVSGTLDLDAIADPVQITDQLFASFRRLPGIGPYGAAHLLAMEGRHDFIAVDTEFRSFVRNRYHGGRRVKESTMLRHYAKWGRWKYLAYWAESWESVAERLQSAMGRDQ
jgi:3-methyladenine DNA glycosylase/8-oxoguanine DNA glycosylase